MTDYTDIELLVTSEIVSFLKIIRWKFALCFFIAVISACYATKYNYLWAVTVFFSLATIAIMIVTAAVVIKFLILGLSLDTRMNIPNIKVELNIPTDKEHLAKETSDVVPN